MWRDISCREVGRQPTAVSIKLGDFVIEVNRYRFLASTWTFRLADYNGFEPRTIRADTVEQAKAAALDLFNQLLSSAAVDAAAVSGQERQKSDQPTASSVSDGDLSSTLAYAVSKECREIVSDVAIDFMQSVRRRVREVKSCKLDDLCWRDYRKLFLSLCDDLPEGREGLEEELEAPGEMLENCKQYVESLHNPSKPYISIQRELERLRAENDDLREEKQLLSEKYDAASRRLGEISV